MIYEDFKRKCIERTDEDGYIKDGYVLCVDGYIVNHVSVLFDKTNDEFIFVNFLAGLHSAIEIYQFEIDENNEYEIEWFILEKE